jgi:hypothetical protein
VRDALEQVPIPEAGVARERTREVVLAAFAEREPAPGRGRLPLVAAVAALVVGAALAIASPPGRAVVERVREIVGVEQAQPALFSVPGGGRLLVDAADGTWVLDADGKKRLLAGYHDASWSPFGRFLVAVRSNELAALEPDGGVRWTLARHGVQSPAWTGTPTDTRIAYVDRSGIRIVAGDGTGDRLLAPAETGPLAWRPGRGFVLAYASARELRFQDAETGRVLWRATTHGNPRLHADLEWSTDGRRVLVVNDGTLQVFDAQGDLVARRGPSDGRIVDATFVHGTHRVLVASTAGGESTVSELATGRSVFAGTGVFDEITSSSDGRWLVVEWRTADQWVFVRLQGRRPLRAFSGIAGQFGGEETAIDGWCCSG